jgi:hypothetical protein
MSLGKRHIGRRVAGIGVGVALMMLGLAAPAMANTTVTAVAPSSGPDNCVVVVTGTGFRTFQPDSANTLNFIAPDGTTKFDSDDWFSISDTEIWAVVPNDLTAGTSYTVELRQASGTFTAGGTFLSTGDTAPGTCAPTITSFAPACASPGDIVTITGTNLLSADNLDNTNSGGDVFFQKSGGGETGPVSMPVPDQSSATSLQVIVPSLVADGPIHVITDVEPTATSNGVFSTTSFLTPPPDCVPAGGNTHARSVSFKIKSTGKASGKVSSTEDPAFTDCVAAVPVKIQRKTSSGWKTVGKTTTSDTGSYAKKVKNPKGKQKFRALAPKVSLGDPVTDVCSKAKSAVRKV